ncbi:hypothetical protein RJ640_021533, partial [Escallonia rubra]
MTKRETCTTKTKPNNDNHATTVVSTVLTIGYDEELYAAYNEKDYAHSSNKRHCVKDPESL